MARCIDADKTLAELDEFFDTHYWQNTALIDGVMRIVNNQKPAEENGDRYVETMKGIAEFSHRDPELGHIRADELLVEFLRAKGYKDLANVFEEVSKWYS